MKAAVIKVQYLSKGHWLVLEDIRQGNRVVHKGAISDFGSIPRILRVAISPMDFPAAAIFHDEDLQMLGQQRIQGRTERFSAWRDINKSMLEAMSKQGRHISWLKTAVVYTGVNIHAAVSCFLLNRHPNPSKSLDDFAGFEVEVTPIKEKERGNHKNHSNNKQS